MEKVDSLQMFKQQLGELVEIDLTGCGLVEAHGQLGYEVGEQVRQILGQRLDTLEEPAWQRKISQARACYTWLNQRAESPDLPGVIRAALGEYLACLVAWTEATEIAGLEHPRREQKIEGYPVTALELALLLQHDNTGCQTGLYRDVDGSVTLWHSEEDFGKLGMRFDKLRIAKFVVSADGAPVTLHAFIYPDLLPGSAFCWRSDNYVQAVDTLMLRNPPQLSHGALANVACWLALRLGCQVKALDVLRVLGPFWDGYALNMAYLQCGRARAKKYEFVGEHILPYPLDEKPGSCLFEANIFCRRRNSQLLALEALPADYRLHFEQRVRRTRRILRESSVHAPAFFLRLLASRAGGEWAYANEDVKAWFLARLSAQGMQVQFGPGPAIWGK